MPEWRDEDFTADWGGSSEEEAFQEQKRSFFGAYRALTLPPFPHATVSTGTLAEAGATAAVKVVQGGARLAASAGKAVVETGAKVVKGAADIGVKAVKGAADMGKKAVGALFSGVGSLFGGRRRR